MRAEAPVVDEQETRGNARAKRGHGMASAGAGRLALVLAGAIFLTGCEEGTGLGSLLPGKEPAAEGAVAPASAGPTVVERDVEAPDVFQVTESGLWDGRPSLGGVWVAHPDVTDPERVMIRHQANGQSVIGALFRRERDVPGPRFQVSSDAAEALGMLAGAPAEINVTALRREEVEIAPPPVADPAADGAEIETAPIDQVASTAAAAIDKAEAGAEPTAARPEPTMSADAIRQADTASAAPAAAPAPAAQSALDKPYLQIGIFSVEANANKTADMLRSEGVIPSVRKSTSNGKDYWRVLAGPAASANERAAILAKIKTLGFADAYAVTN